MFQLSHGIKNIRWSKSYQWYTHLRKTFSQLLLLKICETFLFRQSKKVCSILWSAWALFALLEKRRPNFPFEPFTEKEMTNVILELPTNKVSLSDGIPISISKQSVHVQCTKLTSVINNRLKNKTFLDILKNAQITPCHAIRRVIKELRKITDQSAYFQIFQRRLKD